MTLPDKPPAAGEIDNICTYGTLYGDSPHLTRGPDYKWYRRNGGYRPEKFDRNANRYNGHPVSDASCKRHSKKYVRGIQGASKQSSAQHQREVAQQAEFDKQQAAFKQQRIESKQRSANRIEHETEHQ